MVAETTIGLYHEHRPGVVGEQRLLVKGDARLLHFLADAVVAPLSAVAVVVGMTELESQQQH